MKASSMSRSRYLFAALISILAGGALVNGGAALAKAHAQSHPDLSGVWTVFYHDRPGGRFGAPAEPDLSKQGRKIVDDFAATHDLTKYEPGAYCVPGGMPTVMFGLGGYPIEIIQQPERITILAEIDMQLRRIYMDGRGHPKGFPHTRGGHSIAHWEGKTLVVDTALIKAWPTERWPHSDKTHVVEHISLKKTDALKDVKLRRGLTRKDLGDEVMEDVVTVTDPVMYKGPQTVKVYFRRLPDKEFLEYDCAEGNWWSLIEATAKK